MRKILAICITLLLLFNSCLKVTETNNCIATYHQKSFDPWDKSVWVCCVLEEKQGYKRCKIQRIEGNINHIAFEKVESDFQFTDYWIKDTL